MDLLCHVCGLLDPYVLNAGSGFGVGSRCFTAGKMWEGNLEGVNREAINSLVLEIISMFFKQLSLVHPHDCVMCFL